MDVKDWTYDEFPEFAQPVEGAVRVPTTPQARSARYIPNVAYAAIDGAVLDLQILCPETRKERIEGYTQTYPCIVYVQGSAWRIQNVYQDVPQLGRLAARGYVIAIVRYRHSDLAHFPAQCEDALEAIRFMRAHANQYHIDPERMIIAGNSSGGHTAVFAAIFEAEARRDNTACLGTHESRFPDISARVSGIIDLYGAVSLMREDGYPSTIDHHQPTSPEGMLMGCDLRERPDLCKLASAEYRITPDLDLPPVLIAHGTKDRTASTQLSVDLYEHLRSVGIYTELYLLEGADHGGPDFFSPSMIDRYDAFIQRCFA